MYVFFFIFYGVPLAEAESWVQNPWAAGLILCWSVLKHKSESAQSLNLRCELFPWGKWKEKISRNYQPRIIFSGLCFWQRKDRIKEFSPAPNVLQNNLKGVIWNTYSVYLWESSGRRVKREQRDWAFWYLSTWRLAVHFKRWQGGNMLSGWHCKCREFACLCVALPQDAQRKEVLTWNKIAFRIGNTQSKRCRKTSHLTSTFTK